MSRKLRQQRKPGPGFRQELQELRQHRKPGWKVRKRLEIQELRQRQRQEVEELRRQQKLRRRQALEEELRKKSILLKMNHHKVEKMGRLTKSKMLGIYKSRLHRYKKKNDFFGGVIHWQTRKTKKLTIAITKSMHAFLRLMLAEHYVFQFCLLYNSVSFLEAHRFRLNPRARLLGVM